MRLSPLLLGLAALGCGWASPVLAQDGADCGFLCQLGGYLSTDHMTASPGDAAAGTGAPAKSRKAHTAHKASAKPATQDAAHGTPPAAEHVAARTLPETRTAPTAAAPVKVAAPSAAATKVVATKVVAAKGDHGKGDLGKGDLGKAEGGKTVLAKAAVEPEVRKPAPAGPKTQVAGSHATPTPGATAVRTTADTATKPSTKPTAVKAVMAQTATPASDHGQAHRQADRSGGRVDIASATAVPTPVVAAVVTKPIRAARTALPRAVVAPTAADRPVILLTALAAIPGSAPAISAGFQPTVATLH